MAMKISFDIKKQFTKDSQDEMRVNIKITGGGEIDIAKVISSLKAQGFEII